MHSPFLTEEWLISIRQRLIRFFAVERCPDPQNCVDETLFRVVRAISKGTQITVKLETYIYAVAKLVEKECFRSRIKRNESAIDETFAEPSIPDPGNGDAHQLGLEKCLQELSPFEQALIIQYYEGSQSGHKLRNRKALAERLGMPIKKLRKEAMKIRQKLERCITKCIERE